MLRFALGILFVGSTLVLLAFNAMTVAPGAESKRNWAEIIALTLMILSALLWFTCRTKKFCARPKSLTSIDEN